MNIDWSKAPEGHDYHLAWLHGEGKFYRDGGDRFFRDGGSYACKSDIPSDVVITKRPIAWNGEGLPPTGTVCEAFNKELSNPEWERCTILYSGKFRVMYDSESCYERVGYIDNLEFRPIRTPDQIAAEERSSFIEECRDFSSVTNDWKDVFGMMYDAGYRKFEIVEGE